MLLEKNRQNSCTGNSRYVNVRYFFIKDRIDKGEVRVDYIPSHLMLVDFYTKSLQGTLFKEFRAYITGWKLIEYLTHKIKDNVRSKEDVNIWIQVFYYDKNKNYKKIPGTSTHCLWHMCVTEIYYMQYVIFYICIFWMELVKLQL